MSLEETKAFSFNLSPTTLWAILLGIATTGFGTLYVGITTYNRVIAGTEAIENFKQYDDVEIKKYIAALQNQVVELKAENSALKDNDVLSANTASRLSESTSKAQERASEANAVAIEAKTVAVGSSRETQMTIASLREEMKATREGIEAKMKALQRATTNPLGN